MLIIYSLIPIVVLAPFALSMAAFSLLRTSVKCPDVIINRTNNPKFHEMQLTLIKTKICSIKLNPT